MKIFKVLIIFSLLIFGSCETDIVENDLSYNERLVVRGILEAGKPIQVYFGKTLPLQSAFDSSKANLKDVIAYIKNKNKIDSLVYISDGIYKAKNLMGQNGETYFLFAEWEGRSITAETHIPFSTTFQGGRLDTTIQNGDTVITIKGILTPRMGAVYGATWSIISANPTYVLEDDVIPEIQRSADKDLLGNLTLHTRRIPNDLLKNWRRSLYIRIHAFDEAFYNFFLTQDANAATNNIFTSTGINLRWNIEGDAIGLFIGTSDFIVKIP